jgi:protease-4
MGPFKYYDKPLSEDGGLLQGGVVTQNGIQTVMLTAGRSKDVGNPYRKLTAEEIKVMQTEVNNDYDGFVSYVAERRHITEAAVRGPIGAMAYGTKTAQELGLIDAAGSREDAYVQIAKAAKLDTNYRVVREQTPASFINTLLGAVGLNIGRQAAADPSAAAAAVCSLTQSKLAFYGSTSTLCP